MTHKTRYLTTKEFSQITGISVSTVTQLLREKKIKGVKKSGKWLVDESGLNSTFVENPEKKESVDPGAPNESPLPATYSPAEFSKMTYLAEKGVVEWLKNGRLSGEMHPNGEHRIFASNLETENIQRLLRKT